jgi:hypothetical protein
MLLFLAPACLCVPWLETAAIQAGSAPALSLDQTVCPCQRYSAVCTPHCCCDSSCPAPNISLWRSLSLCSDALQLNSTLQGPSAQKVRDLFAIRSNAKLNFFGYYYPANVTGRLLGRGWFDTRESAGSLPASSIYLPGVSLRTDPNTELQIRAGSGSNCIFSSAQFAIPSTSSCTLKVTAANCASLASHLPTSLCSSGACGSTVSAAYPTARQTPSLSGTTCSNIPLSVKYTVSVGGFTQAAGYALSAVQVDVQYGSAQVGALLALTSRLEFAVPASLGGSIGYQPGLLLKFFTNASGTFTPQTTLSLKFGHNLQLRYTPVQNDQYQMFRSLANNSLALSKLGNSSYQEYVAVTRAAATTIEQIPGETLLILYSKGGALGAEQFHVLAATVYTSDASVSFTERFFRVKFQFVDS